MSFKKFISIDTSSDNISIIPMSEASDEIGLGEVFIKRHVE